MLRDINGIVELKGKFIVRVIRFPVKKGFIEGLLTCIKLQIIVRDVPLYQSRSFFNMTQRHYIMGNFFLELKV